MLFTNNRVANIFNSFTDPVSMEDKAKQIKKSIEQREKAIELQRLKKAKQEQEEADKQLKEQEVQEQIVAENLNSQKKKKSIITELPVNNTELNLSKKFKHLAGNKLFEVAPEVTAQQFVKDILSLTDDMNLKKNLVTEQNRLLIVKAKQDRGTLKIKLGKQYLFRFL